MPTSIDEARKKTEVSIAETGAVMLRARHELGPPAFWEMVDTELKIDRLTAVRTMRLALLVEARDYAQ